MLFTIVLLALALCGCEINNWSGAGNYQSMSSPALSSHSDNRLYIAAVGTNSVIAYTSAEKPSQWDTWQPIGPEPRPLFNPETAPILVRDDTFLHVLARGTDNNLYHAKKAGSTPWSAWEQILAGNQVTGRISAAITRAAGAITSELHAVYASEYYVRYARFRDGNLLATHSWIGGEGGGIEGVVASDAKDRIAVAKRYTLVARYETATRATQWAFEPMGEQHQALDVSNIVYFDMAFHVLSSQVESGKFNLVHSRVVPGANSVTKRVISSGWPEPQLSSLALYRNKLVAVWSAPNGRIAASRWDNADPAGPWVGTTSVTDRTSKSRPALAALNRRPMISGQEWSLPNFGNDLFSAISMANADGNVAYINLSRHLLHFDIHGDLSIWNPQSTQAPPSCGLIGAPSGSLESTNLRGDGRAVLTEIGFNLWMLPSWFTKGLYARYATVMCNGPWESNTAPCRQKRIPVYLMMLGDPRNINNCAGAWQHQFDDYIRIWEELGHYVVGPLRLRADDPEPTQQDSTMSNISLAALKDARQIYGERVTPAECISVPASFRCLGFVRNNMDRYDTTGREHSFIYAVYYYLTDGDNMRQLIQDDIAVGDDLLKRRYCWVKQHIFRGMEFRGQLEPWIPTKAVSCPD